MKPETIEDEPSLDARDVLSRSLEGERGGAWRRRLAELCDTEAFQQYVRRDFPSQAQRLLDPLQRRDFLRVMGASLAAAGLGACTRQPEEKIVPFARNPESRIPGVPEVFATSMSLGGAAIGLLVESHMGRPTKVEGNPAHPASLGATDSFAQAAILSLYDPDRSHSVLNAGQISTWGAFQTALSQALDHHEALKGAGLAVLVADVAAPTMRAELARMEERFPMARVHHWRPDHRDGARRGAQLAFGRDLSVRYDLSAARVVVSLDADFLVSGAGGVRYAREFAEGRRVRRETRAMSRFYALESAPSLTGANADHRLGMRPSEVESCVRALAARLGVDVEAPRLSAEQDAFVERIADELRGGSGQCVVIAGETQSAEVHALAHAIHREIGALGRTVELTEPVAATPESATDSIAALVEAMRADQVETLVVLGGNPVYDAPADLDFREALERVSMRIHLSLHEDETSELCHWHVPEAHFLESWGDARSFDGTASLVQPLIAPLYDGKSALSLVALLAGETGVSDYELVRRYWRAELPDRNDDDAFEAFWHEALHEGVIADTRLPALSVDLVRSLDFGPAPAPPRGLELALRTDASVYDGRFANNGWLQELPRALSRLTWDNAALLSEASAARLEVENGDRLELELDGRRLVAPVWVLPGHPDELVTLHLGYGRTSAGELGNGVGVDAYHLRSGSAPWNATGLQARRASGRHAFANVQDHGRMEGRDILRTAEFDRFQRDPEHTWPSHGDHDPAELSLYEGHASEGHAWGMVIDLNACVGCNACMTACQSENNVPVVGKEEVAKGRELHWIRIDRYYEERADGETVARHQPVPCMHCEEAPCEVVCPVGATVHSAEGLNEMVYNRCVGTRYCSNNCPYKVRRFNFFAYSDYETESLKLANNPDVTVRSRGVMEKCTYCVQRINQTRIEAKKDGRPIGPNEVKTACQQVCPTQAIAFGDLNQPESDVARLRHEPQHYALLGELGTKPRTTYLANFENPDAESTGATAR